MIDEPSKRVRNLSYLLLALGLASTAQANVTLSSLFADHLVLQREKPLPIWGWADPGEKVTVSFAGQQKAAKIDTNGKWLVTLDPLKASDQPQDLTVTGAHHQTLTVKDVLVGEVWLCSGQSNMGMTVKGVTNADKEIAEANYPLIRMYSVGSGSAVEPQDKCRGQWQVTTPATVGGFSASAYFFGRNLFADLKIPVGLINSSVGGTAIEAWTSMDVMKDKPELQSVLKSWNDSIAQFEKPENKAKYEEALAKWKADAAQAAAAKTPAPRQPAPMGRNPLDGNRPANLYNGKIAPLIPFAIRGAIWYQGESNAGNGPLYAVQLPLMINDWRARWQEEFPFAWVQLPNFLKKEEAPEAPSTWARLREAETKTLSLPKTGMTINLDIGETANIHPRNKQEIGRRLSLWARAEVYGEKIPYSGPLYQSHEIKGSEVILHFQHADGLKTTDGAKEVKGFAIADETQNWKWATATIHGDTVVVSNPEIKQPAAVRYAWANNPDINLVNGADLPAGPFRTDDWPMDNHSLPIKTVKK